MIRIYVNFIPPSISYIIVYIVKYSVLNQMIFHTIRTEACKIIETKLEATTTQKHLHRKYYNNLFFEARHSQIVIIAYKFVMLKMMLKPISR